MYVALRTFWGGGAEGDPEGRDEVCVGVRV